MKHKITSGFIIFLFSGVLSAGAFSQKPKGNYLISVGAWTGNILSLNLSSGESIKIDQTGSFTDFGLAVRIGKLDNIFTLSGRKTGFRVKLIPVRNLGIDVASVNELYSFRHSWDFGIFSGAESVDSLEGEQVLSGNLSAKCGGWIIRSGVDKGLNKFPLALTINNTNLFLPVGTRKRLLTLGLERKAGDFSVSVEAEFRDNVSYDTGERKPDRNINTVFDFESKGVQLGFGFSPAGDFRVNFPFGYFSFSGALSLEQGALAGLQGRGDFIESGIGVTSPRFVFDYRHWFIKLRSDGHLEPSNIFLAEVAEFLDFFVRGTGLLARQEVDIDLLSNIDRISFETQKRISPHYLLKGTLELYYAALSGNLRISGTGSNILGQTETTVKESRPLAEVVFADFSLAQSFDIFRDFNLELKASRFLPVLDNGGLRMSAKLEYLF